jgi:hypothetical protein
MDDMDLSNTAPFFKELEDASNYLTQGTSIYQY